MTFHIRLFDGFSTLRERLERRGEPPHMLIRGLINDATRPGCLTIFVFDGRGGNDARRAIWPPYKTRPPKPSHIQQGMQMLREMLAFTPAWTAHIDGFEADDLIAAFVSFFEDDPIEILTRDGDLRALCSDRVTCTAQIKNPVPPQWVRLSKLMVGDRSDTIPGVKGFGRQSWDEADLGQLSDFMDSALSGDVPETGPLPQRCINWIRENPADLQAMWSVLQPLPIDADQLAASITKGVNNPAAREAMMKEFIL